MEFAPLIKAVCAQENADKTFYMPPTRELSMSRRNLLVRYCDKVIAENLPNTGLVPVPGGSNSTGGDIPLAPFVHEITTREELIVALQEAVAMEHQIMIQYLYAAWSIPNEAYSMHLFFSTCD